MPAPRMMTIRISWVRLDAGTPKRVTPPAITGLESRRTSAAGMMVSSGASSARKAMSSSIRMSTKVNSLDGVAGGLSGNLGVDVFGQLPGEVEIQAGGRAHLPKGIPNVLHQGSPGTVPSGGHIGLESDLVGLAVGRCGEVADRLDMRHGANHRFQS